MFYGPREEQDKTAKRKIDAYRQAASLFPLIRDVVQTFDNKVYNCRLEKALKEKDHRMYVEKRFNYLAICCYVQHYNDNFTLASIKLDDMPEGKRIPAELIIEDARERRANILKKAYEMEKAMQNIDFYAGQLGHYAAQIKKIVDSVPFEIRDIYNLNYRIQH